MSFNKSSNFPDYGATDSRISRIRNATILPKSNFDINTYHQLCDCISSNIFSIKNNVTALEKASKEKETALARFLLRDKIHTTQQSTKELVDSTTKFLKELTVLVSNGSIEHRLQAERVRNEFQATVLRYNTLQKQAMLQIQPGSSCNVLNDEDVETDEKQPLMESERLHQQHQLQEELEFEQGLILEREQKIRLIESDMDVINQVYRDLETLQFESDMLDVNQVLRDPAAMVHEQGDTIGTNEENVTPVAYNVEEVQQQLAEASSYQKAYRKMVCCIILIILLVAVALTIIIYFSLHS